MCAYRYHVFFALLNALLLGCCSVTARSQTIAIQVSDLKDRPIVGAILSTKADGSTSAPTDIAGKTRVQLPAGLHTGEELALVLVKSKPTNLSFLSPWQGRAIVPKFPGFIEVVLGVIGDRAALQNSKVVGSLSAEIWRQNVLAHGDPKQRERALQAVSNEAGFKAEEVDTAIRAVFRARILNDTVRDAITATQRKSIEAYVRDYPTSPQRD